MGETVIETGRLIIREFVPEDLEALYRIYESADTRFLQPLSEDREEELEKLKSYIQYVYGFYGFGLWAVCLKETGALIGRSSVGCQMSFTASQTSSAYSTSVPVKLSGEYSSQIFPSKFFAPSLTIFVPSIAICLMCSLS